ncbi:uncharacterized protein LOC110983872 [Acanthaster planci]|uniref:Uncharacterized protein LOC110983872 n=1 Tax=Acanthaster planci TaxID=133434 RepID=A0A8B7Z0R4_ACAPL|nr:uncharacterized protein LOC110983872 [Acanthaster planci]
MPKVSSAKKFRKKAKLEEALRGASDHSSSCMCETILPKALATKPHCGWYDLIDFDPSVEEQSFLLEKPLTDWTQVAHGKAVEARTVLSEFRAFVSDQSLLGFWTGLIIWQRDSAGYVHCPFPCCDMRLSGTSAVHTLLQRHWRYQHARPYLCNICGSSYATDGALKVHFFRTRHNEDGRSRGKKPKGAGRQGFSVHRREAIVRYILKAERLMDESGQ